MRRAAAPLLVLAAALLLAGCPAAPQEELKPDTVDRERVARIAKDPWAAPTTTSLPRQAYGSNGLLVRKAGVREATLPGDDNRPMVRDEVDAAIDDGWALVGAVCDELGVEEVQLTRGTTLDDTARATIVPQPEGTRDAPAYRIVVTVYVPHHADRGWPRPEPVDLESTCVASPDAPSIEVDDVTDGSPYPATTS